MKIKTMASAVVSAALVAGLIGCNPRPRSVVDVDQSVLPPPAKAMLPQDATYDRVQEETYSRGDKIYVITYTVNGQQKKIKYNPKDRTDPDGVFNMKHTSQDVQ